uniref:Nucleoside phosphorylase domain-containing protein n=1 Tax=Solanum lycopersicum TaxID=4081 RepID=A0A3Q7HR58_SOLLC
MESAAVALICYQQKVPYIVIRALSDMAGGGTSESNEASTFITLAATNSVEVTVQFINQLATKKLHQDASCLLLVPSVFRICIKISKNRQEISSDQV